MKSEATTVDEFLGELPEERRRTVAAVRDMVREALPDGFTEGVNWGMISWELPLERYPDTYNGKPLVLAALASQKRHCSLYLHGAYMDPALVKRLEDGFAEAGRKLDMGKACVRFRSVEDLPAHVIREVVGALDPDRFVALYEAVRSGAGSGRSGRRKGGTG